MIEFNKSVFDNAFKKITSVEVQSEKMITSLIDKAAWLPDDGKKVIFDWISAYRNGRNDFKATTDDKYEKVANYFMKQVNAATSHMK
jgi:hypothetical protein